VRSGSRDGFALLAALWLLIAISAIGLELSIRSRGHRLQVANAVDASRLRAVADGGIETAYAILEGRVMALRRDGETDPNRLIDPWGDFVSGSASPRGDAEERERARRLPRDMSLRLEDAGALLNLNLAGEEQLRRFFLAFRLDLGQADRLAQAIADWRDADGFRRGRGAEADDYAREGLPGVPANRPFDQLEELRAVRGMDDRLFARVLPHLTLIGSGRVNLNQASEEVLLSLPGMSEQAVQVLQRRRAADRAIRNLNDLLLELSEGPRLLLQAAAPELQNHIIFETQEVIATATAAVKGNPVVVHTQGLFVRAGDAVFLTWRWTD
jgi:type II secretory pathway component PulK